MLKRIYLFISQVLLLYSGSLFAARSTQLIGILHTHPGWAPVLYIQAVTDMDNLGIVDSIIPDSFGHFTYSFTDLDQRSGLVRMWVVPLGAPRNTSIEGLDENQCFLALPPSGEDLNWEGDAEALFYSSRLNSSELNQLTLWMRDLKIPFRNWMEKQRGILTTDSGAMPFRQAGV